MCNRIGGISPLDISENAKGEREKGNEIPSSADRDKRPERFSGYPGRQPYVNAVEEDRDRLRRPNGHNQACQ